MNASRRFWLLQSLLAALLIAAAVAGYLDQPFTGAIAPACYALSGLTLAGLIAIMLGNETWPRWLAPRLPAFALLGTVAGFIVALSHAGQDQSQALQGAATALYSTGFGIAGWLWLSLTLKLAKGRAEDE